MKVSTATSKAKRVPRTKPEPSTQVMTANGVPVPFPTPLPGDQLAICPAMEAKSKTSEQEGKVLLLPAPIIGWARTSTGISVYLPGSTSASFRSALEEEGRLEECFFTSPTPTTLCEVAVQEYGMGELIYYPAPQQQFLFVATTAA